MKRGLEISEPSYPFLQDADGERAWAGFLEACLSTVDLAVRRAAVDEDLARDVAAEVLVRMHKDWPELLRRYTAGKGRAGFRVWLAVVARNHAIDVLRARHGRRTLPRPIARLERWRQVLYRLVIEQDLLLAQAAQELGYKGLWQGKLVELAEALQEIQDLVGGSGASRVRPSGARPLGETEDPSEDARRDPDRNQSEARLARDRSHTLLFEILREFDPEDRFLLRVYFLEGVSAWGIAKVAGFSTASHVYERARVVMQELRRAAEDRGLQSSDLDSLAHFDCMRPARRGALDFGRPTTMPGWWA